MDNKLLEKEAKKFLYENSKFPYWWINELPAKKLIAIYFSEKQKNRKKGKAK